MCQIIMTSYASSSRGLSSAVLRTGFRLRYQTFHNHKRANLYAIYNLMSVFLPISLIESYPSSNGSNRKGCESSRRASPLPVFHIPRRSYMIVPRPCLSGHRSHQCRRSYKTLAHQTSLLLERLLGVAIYIRHRSMRSSY